jgi:hypothetical protein
MAKLGKDVIGHSGDVLKRRTSVYQNAKLISKTALKKVLCNVFPPVSLIFNAYRLADTIYDNWNSIKQLFEATEEGKLTEAMISAIEIGSNMVLQKLNDLTCSVIDLSLNVSNKQEIDLFLGSLTNYLTSTDIDAVGYYLQTQLKPTRNSSKRTKNKAQENAGLERTNYKEKMDIV